MIFVIYVNLSRLIQIKPFNRRNQVFIICCNWFQNTFECLLACWDLLFILDPKEFELFLKLLGNIIQNIRRKCRIWRVKTKNIFRTLLSFNLLGTDLLTNLLRRRHWLDWLHTFDTRRNFTIWTNIFFLIWKEWIWILDVHRLGFEEAFTVRIRIEGTLLILIVDIFFISEKCIIFRWDFAFVDKEVWNSSVLVLEFFDIQKFLFDLHHFRSSQGKSHWILVTVGLQSASTLHHWDLFQLCKTIVETFTTDNVIAM